MTIEEPNTVTWTVFSNNEYLFQEPELKQDLGNYTLVQPRTTALSHDAEELIDTQSQ